MEEFNQNEFMNDQYYVDMFNELNQPAQLFVVNHLHSKKALIPENLRLLKKFLETTKPMLLLYIWIMRIVQWFIITVMLGRKRLLTFAWLLGNETSTIGVQSFLLRLQH